MQWLLLPGSTGSKVSKASVVGAHGLGNFSAMCSLPGSGIEPKSPTLIGGFFTTKPPGKPSSSALNIAACTCQSQPPSCPPASLLGRWKSRMSAHLKHRANPSTKNVRNGVGQPRLLLSCLEFFRTRIAQIPFMIEALRGRKSTVMFILVTLRVLFSVLGDCVHPVT